MRSTGPRAEVASARSPACASAITASARRATWRSMRAPSRRSAARSAAARSSRVRARGSCAPRTRPGAARSGRTSSAASAASALCASTASKGVRAVGARERRGEREVRERLRGTRPRRELARRERRAHQREIAGRRPFTAPVTDERHTRAGRRERTRLLREEDLRTLRIGKRERADESYVHATGGPGSGSASDRIAITCVPGRRAPDRCHDGDGDGAAARSSR